MDIIKKLFAAALIIATGLVVKSGAQTVGCGGTYPGMSGTISSPHYPSNYDNNLNCVYYIETSPQSSVNITFISFATELCCDWLQINCSVGYIVSSQRFYGTSLPPFFSIQSCSRITIQFFTDVSVVNQGFSLRYEIGNGIIGGLTMKPMNKFYRNETTVVLSCASRFNLPGVSPWWSYSTDGYKFTAITALNCSVLSSLSYRFNTTSQYSTRTCNLTISLINLPTTVQIFTCTDSTMDSASALTTLLGFPFFAFTDSSSSTEVVRDDQFTVTCGIQVAQTLYPSVQTISSIYLYSEESPRQITASNITATTIVSASPDVLPSYICHINFSFPGDFPTGYATNLPQNISFSTPTQQVLYWPENERMLIAGEDNGKVTTKGNLTCYVPANPPSLYHWTDNEYGYQWDGPTINVTHNGAYTCTASNVIRGRTYNASKSVAVTIDDKNVDKNASEVPLNTVALIVGVVLGAVVLLLLVMVIVAFVCLCRKRDVVTASNSQNINAQATTTENVSSNNLYEMTHRDTLYANNIEIGTSGAHNSAYDADLSETHKYEALK